MLASYWSDPRLSLDINFISHSSTSTSLPGHIRLHAFIDSDQILSRKYDAPRLLAADGRSWRECRVIRRARPGVAGLLEPGWPQ